MNPRPTLELRRILDFDVTGDGTNRAWEQTDWQPLARVGAGASELPTRLKLLYSASGIYFLTDAEDRRLTATYTEHFSDLFKEDVIEVFLWPDERQPVYFEYELSPLGCELPLLVANNGKRFHGWLPWHYTANRQTRFATQVRGGEKQAHAAITGWTTEFFIPFDLLTGFGQSPPPPGTAWRANIYRIDYDESPASQWAWSTATGGHFHDYENFGRIVFGGPAAAGH